MKDGQLSVLKLSSANKLDNTFSIYWSDDILSTFQYVWEHKLIKQWWNISGHFYTTNGEENLISKNNALGIEVGWYSKKDSNNDGKVVLLRDLSGILMNEMLRVSLLRD